MLSKLYVLSLAVLVFALGAGCGDTIKDPVDSDDNKSSDVEDGGDEKDSDEIKADWDLSACEPAKLCSGLDDVKDCVADFGLGTNQAGYPPNGYERYVGLYAYNDHEVGSSMVPKPNPDNSEPAVKTLTCDDDNNEFALYMKAEGFTNWGAGVGIDWGGDPNPDCDEPGALDCLQIGIDNDKFLLADAEKDERCQNADGTVSEKKISCLTKGKVIKEPKDLTAYAGIGFWILTTEENEASSMKISFPIPDTTRFYGACSDDDGLDSTKCFNDYATTVNLAKKDAGKWVYKEVLFSDTSWSIYWGLQLDKLDYEAYKFPKDKSMGIKFQVDSVQADGSFPKTEFYMDDITLIK